jgi:hypothetical protein
MFGEVSVEAIADSANFVGGGVNLPLNACEPLRVFTVLKGVEVPGLA